MAFKLKSHSIGTVLYTIKQGTYHYDGKISYPIDLNAKVNDFDDYTFKDVIKLLSDNGYKEQLKIDASTYSIISTDNPDNPKTVFLNLPISWDSQGAKLNVTFDEKSL